MQIILLYFVVFYYYCSRPVRCWNMSMFSLETKTEEAKCFSPDFKCDLSKCIKSSYLCDGIEDCADGSDESDSTCETKMTCHKPLFQCKSGRNGDVGECLKHTLRCNGKTDCYDASDESDCPVVPLCKGFTCSTGRCISASVVCDGFSNCKYGEDEENCPFKCGHGLYRCGESQCINETKICDNSNDCYNGADESESCHIDECYSKRKRCDHNCHDKPIGYNCTCNKGYDLSPDLHHCQDIDECKIPGSCSQHCYNTLGDFSCGCKEGYTLTDKMKCTAIGEEMFFIMTSSNGIYRVNMNTSPPSKDLLVTSGEIGAVSHLTSLGLVYWSDMVRKQILRVSLFHPNKPQVIIENLLDVDGLVVDWIAYKLYWSEHASLKVSGLNGEDVTVLLTNTKMKSLVIDPRQGHCFIYWCTWGTDSKIERISLDGDISTRLTIHSQRRSKPKNLIIDFTTNRLFWLDAQHGTIGSRHLDGGHIFYEVEPSPLSIAIFEDIIYWIGRNKQTIFMMNKLTGVNETLYNSTMNADLIFAFHEQLQPAVLIPESKPHCTHLRLLSHKRGYKCICPAPLQLLQDRETCNTLDAVSCHKDFCYHGGVCVHEKNGEKKTFPKCLCPADYNGTRCETRIVIFQTVFQNGRLVQYKCVDNYCYNQGTCVEYTTDQQQDNPLKPKCSCTRGYYGDRCEYYYGYMLDPMKRRFAAVYGSPGEHLHENDSKDISDSAIHLAVGISVVFLLICVTVIFVTNRLTRNLPKYDVVINPIYVAASSKVNEDHVFLNTDLISIPSTSKKK